MAVASTADPTHGATASTPVCSNGLADQSDQHRICIATGGWRGGAPRYFAQPGGRSVAAEGGRNCKKLCNKSPQELVGVGPERQTVKLQFFAIPAISPGPAQEEFNRFVASHRVARVEKELITDGAASFWSVCVDGN